MSNTKTRTKTVGRWPSVFGTPPRFATPRNHKLDTYGPAVAATLTALTGLQPWPWQRYVLDVSLEVLPGGGWAHPEVLISVPRQCGKTTLFAPLFAHRCGREGGRSTWITAQSREKAVMRWHAASKLITKTDKNAQMFVSNSHERTTWENGSVFRPFAPSEAALDGETPDLLALDELWYFGEQARRELSDSYEPAVDMNLWGQQFKTSTAGTPNSTWLNADRARGRHAVEIGAGQFAFFEWSVPESVGGIATHSLPDHQLAPLIVKHHPLAGLHHSITVENIAAKLADPQKRRSVLRGWGNLTTADDWDTVIPVDIWDEGAWRGDDTDPKLLPEGGRIGVGVEVDRLGRASSIVAAWRSPAGIARVEHIKTEPGALWLPADVRSMVQRWNVGAVAVNYAGPARGVADTLAGDDWAQQDGMLIKVNFPTYQAAAARFVGEFLEPHKKGNPPTIRHDGASSQAITDAMKATDSRPGSTGLILDDSSQRPNTEFAAATLAVWAADHLAPEPTRPFKWVAY